MFRRRKEIYLDNNATTAIAPAVVKKMQHVLKYTFGNPSSLYQVAQRSSVLLEESRKTVASAIGAEPDELVFTGSASEGNNTILKGLFDIFYPRKKTIIASPIEHPSVQLTLDYLSTKGLRVLYLPVDCHGLLQVDALESMIDGDVFLVCAMLANNETGSVQDIRSLAHVARRHNILTMSDCVQALGKIEFSVRDLGIDYATFSAHKIHGPKGAGGIYVRRGSPLLPLIHGGHQESGLRAGTESLQNIAGFAEAAGNINRLLAGSQRMGALKEYLVSELKRLKPDVQVISPIESCLPNTLSVRFTGMSNAYLMAALDYYGIAVSAGSACNSQENEPSHVLTATGLSAEGARETLRISLGTPTTKKEIEFVITALRDILNEKNPPIGVLDPRQLQENILFDENHFILDIRFPYDRMIMKSISQSHETSLIQLRSHYHHIPRQKNIILICQVGIVSPFAAFFLRRKGYKNVSILRSGMVGWKMTHPDLYAKLAGKDVYRLVK
jgi:cysteine desulfurase